MRGDGLLLLAIDRDEIGEVVLTLFVRGADVVERGEERSEIEGVNAGVDLGNRLLRRAGIALFDDLRDLAAGADDASVAKGPRKDRGDDGCGGRGGVNFEEIIRALNAINYQGPLSVEWEDSGMDRQAGAREACEFVKKLDFEPSRVAFDAAFEKG